MQGTIAVTDPDWYERLRLIPSLDEANFWKPSATRTFRAEPFSPFLFKLRGQQAICGFGYFARYSRLPVWLAWDTFGTANGCATLPEMRQRIEGIRERMRFRGESNVTEIGCILILQPVFFPRSYWVDSPHDWPVHLQGDKKYDLARDEGARIWRDCLLAAQRLNQVAYGSEPPGILEEQEPRFGAPVPIRPRLGQGTFRIAVTDAYERACAVTEEHSLPALEAAHIRPYGAQGPHETANGILLRADFHRLFDQGYLTIGPDSRLAISSRLRQDYENGRSYYPFEGKIARLPRSLADRPGPDFLEWHRENVYLG